MQIRLNGNFREVAEGTTVRRLLEDLRLHPQRVAVQVNLEIVRRGEQETLALRPGDEVEVLTFMAGG
jgi:sulfur carrier protein